MNYTDVLDATEKEIPSKIYGHLRGGCFIDLYLTADIEAKEWNKMRHEMHSNMNGFWLGVHKEGLCSGLYETINNM
jgi:hypothetical protein